MDPERKLVEHRRRLLETDAKRAAEVEAQLQKKYKSKVDSILGIIADRMTGDARMIVIDKCQFYLVPNDHQTYKRCIAYVTEILEKIGYRVFEYETGVQISISYKNAEPLLHLE